MRNIRADLAVLSIPKSTAGEGRQALSNYYIMTGIFRWLFNIFAGLSALLYDFFAIKLTFRMPTVME